MRKGFYFRLAGMNLKRNKLLGLPYFLASSVMIAVYFMVLTIIHMRSLTTISVGETLQIMFSVGIVIMTLLIIIFMAYIESFLIKRRKKEFGLYSVLGLEKRHIARVIFWENLMRSFASLCLGIVSGCVFGRLVFMLLASGMKLAAGDSSFSLPPEAFCITAIVFFFIFLLNTVLDWWQIGKTKTVELLKGEHKAEKPPRGMIPLTLLGLALLAWAYYTSITIKSPIAALAMFFVAVFAVIIATYLLFTTGSVFFLRLLKKNKRFYYNPNNFVAVSSMFHRMKQNAVGLASICILSTMVLVTVVTTVSMNVGVDDMLTLIYPDEAALYLNDTSDEQTEKTLQTVTAVAEKNNVTYTCDSYLIFCADNYFYTGKANYSLDMLSYPNIILESDYTRLTGETLPENEDALMLYLPSAKEKLPAMTNAYHISASRESSTLIEGTWSGGVSTTLVFRDMDTAIAYLKGNGDYYAKVPDSINFIKKIRLYPVGADADVLNFLKELKSTLRAEKYTATVTNADGTTETIQRSVMKDLSSRIALQSEFYGVYGGLLFLGAFFTVLFLCNTALLIYFKQVSEGYDDRERFAILQKVGMDDREVKKTINKQVRIVFFLPLAVALLHLAAAGNMIFRLLQCFGLNDMNLTLLCAVVTSVIFGLVYYIVFKLTAKAYLSIVKTKQTA